MNLLADKVAVITGSTRGLGLGIAKAYAAEGAAVVIAGRTQATLDTALADLKASGARVGGIVCDVADLKQVEALGAFAVETFGALDIWVNNAGLSAPYGPTALTPPDGFMKVINTNIIGLYNGSLVALRYLLPKHKGKLINLLGRGDTKGVKFQNAYSASKTWVRTFTITLAEENKDSGLEVMAFNPGLVDTDMLRHVEAIQGYEQRVKPLENVIRLWANPPELPAQKAVWLASNATDGKNGLVFSLLSPQHLLVGILRDTVRRLLRRPARDTSLDIQTITPEL
jgi:glucose 1-dehydrogenase